MGEKFGRFRRFGKFFFGGGLEELDFGEQKEQDEVNEIEDEVIEHGAPKPGRLLVKVALSKTEREQCKKRIRKRHPCPDASLLDGVPVRIVRDRKDGRTKRGENDDKLELL